MPTLRPSTIALAALAFACSGEPESAPVVPTPPVQASLRLEPVDRLVRASLTLRGIRPSEAELNTIVADPQALEGLVDGWLVDPLFGETVKDIHAERFLLRTDTAYQLPVMGVLSERGYNQAQLHESSVEAPLELVKQIVTEDLPYGDVLTADYTLADVVVADIYGLPFDRAVGGWQRTQWVDGRPQSGLLSDSEMWRRHVSNAANFHRGRANFVSNTFLCEDIGGRDVFVGGGVDVSDEFEVAAAVSTDPGCVACHSVLDPMAAFFWGYKEQLKRGAIQAAYDSNCEWDWSQGDPPRGSYRVEHWCYPLKFYDVEESDGWSDWGLRPPGYFGAEAHDVRDLGWMVREDPRFAECTARSVWSWLAQTPRGEAPDAVVNELRDVFVSSGQSFKALTKAAVMHEAFATVDAGQTSEPAVGLLSLRPEALARTIEDLTGFEWKANLDLNNCGNEPNLCWGSVDLARSDRFGFRAMFGGVDGVTVTHPIHTPTATKVMALEQMSWEAAGFVVMTDLGAPSGSPRALLTLVGPADRDETLVREQLAALQRRVLTQEPTTADVDGLFELWSAVVARSDDPAEGWRIVVSALLQDPRMVLY